MMNIKATIIVTIILIPLLASLVSAGTPLPTEQSLLQAWEKIQKDDPRTVTFERLEERRYKFKTTLFPYDGQISILNVVISREEYNDNAIVGVIEVELQNLTEDFQKSHQYSYNKWASNNSLMYDPNTSQWMTGRDYWKLRGTRLKETMPTPSIISKYWADILFGIALAILFIVALVSFFASLFYSHKILCLHKEAQKMQQQENEYLREILKTIRERGTS